MGEGVENHENERSTRTDGVRHFWRRRRFDLAETRPALFDLSQDRSMPADFAIIAVDRVDSSDEELRGRLHDGVKKFSRQGRRKPAEWSEFARHIRYQQGDFKSCKPIRPWANSARNWKRNGAPKSTASSTWPHRRHVRRNPAYLGKAGLARDRNGRGSWSRNRSAMTWSPRGR